jgi:hypothetical protein
MKLRAGPNDLLAYQTLFVSRLCTIYSNVEAGAAMFIDGLVYQPFVFGTSTDGVEWISDPVRLRHLTESMDEMPYRYYEHNTAIIVKPDGIEYWGCFAVIDDGAKMLDDLFKQGY